MAKNDHISAALVSEAPSAADFFYRMLLDHIYDGVYFVDRNRRISYWNKGAERITGYSAAEVVGKNCSHSLLMHVDSEGRNLCHGTCPLTESISDGELRTRDLFLLHKQGHRVPITVRTTPIRIGGGPVIGAVEIFTDNTGKADVLGRLAECERLAYRDPLTELANRRFAEITLASRHEEMQRYGWQFGVIFIDIDDFKRVNDRHGHAIGDDVLRLVGRTLSANARSFDVVGRWGGEEFVFVVAHVDGSELRQTAERLRVLVKRSRLPGGEGIETTISLGAALSRTDESIPDLLGRADRLMYASKSAGKNRTTCED